MEGIDGIMARGIRGGMKELVRSNDAVLLSWLAAALAGESIEAIILDVHTSVIEGSVGAIARRVMVAEWDLPRAKRVLAAADRIGQENGGARV